ncbi:MAG: hypothetical protein KatS3mg010_1712 [Acidimicrobiia bacterium]|nr:MAG: hypothetical protein KatS3mg010_1712 [Acidimicrobiia bacterium]
MVDGVLLLVDASEGPLPQTRFVLRKALEARLPVILVVNKVDRADARIAEVVDEVYELFIDLGATEDQIDFPIVYTNARAGWASLDPDVAGADLKPLCELVLEHIPAPVYEDGHPFQALVTNLDASPYVGRLAICRVRNGTVRRGQPVAWCRTDGSIERARITELYMTDALDRVEVGEAGPGDVIAVAGLPDVTLGETLADARRPAPAPAADGRRAEPVDDDRHQHVAARGPGRRKLTARLVEARLRQELVGNVSLRVFPTERPDAWEVQGRGELQLAVLVETMRREGYELTVGKPQVVTREIDGKLHEPFEALTIDVPEDYLGVVSQLLALRKGRMEQMVNHGTGWVRIDFRVPARGLIGFRTEFLTETRGTGMLHHVFDGYAPWSGELKTRRRGSMVADRRGLTTTYALMNLQERGAMFVGPGTEVYEGMIVGENARDDDMDVNPTKEKKLTNMRAASAEGAGAARPAAPDVARAGARVHRRGRVRRGDAEDRATAQGRAAGERARGQAQSRPLSGSLAPPSEPASQALRTAEFVTPVRRGGSVSGARSRGARGRTRRPRVDRDGTSSATVPRCEAGARRHPAPSARCAPSRPARARP